MRCRWRHVPPAFHATLAAIQLAKGDTAAAIATARRAVELDPNLLAAGNTLGNAHLRAGDAEAAVAVYRQLLLRRTEQPRDPQQSWQCTAGAGRN
ncbi:tetratricopeptide repeat protein [Defluviicoccus vanus]|uniref:tetratricopeptide repeat protein n=1 Tax=Defluviicoccus vanus TaxID=111831 RepID=UPI003898E907